MTPGTQQVLINTEVLLLALVLELEGDASVKVFAQHTSVQNAMEC